MEDELRLGKYCAEAVCVFSGQRETRARNE